MKDLNLVEDYTEKRSWKMKSGKPEIGAFKY